MANKEKIDYLLLDIRELEKMIAGMRDAEIYPVSFFSQAYGLTHKILTDLHALEGDQLETLRLQMEAHKQMISSIPLSEPMAQPKITIPKEPEVTEVQETEREEDVAARTEVMVEEIFIPLKEETPIIIETPKEEEVSKIPPTPIAVQEPVVQEPLNAATPIQEEIPNNVEKGIVTEKKGTVFLSEILEKKQLSDLKKAISLNDRFRFRRELFGGDEEKMSKAITELNQLQSYEESISYLNEVLNWNVEDEAVADFIVLLEKRFL